jgi:hypothetical protein
MSPIPSSRLRCSVFSCWFVNGSSPEARLIRGSFFSLGSSEHYFCFGFQPCIFQPLAFLLYSFLSLDKFLMRVPYFLGLGILNVTSFQVKLSVLYIRLLATLLALSVFFCSTFLSRLLLFFICSLYLSFLAFPSSALVSLVLLLVYLGALMVLFTYFWMFITSFALPSTAFLLPLLLIFLCISPSLLVPSPVSSFLLGSSLLTFLGLVLFLAIVVVVSILDLSLGGFTS